MPDSGAPVAAAAPSDEVTEHVDVPDEHVGRVIGKSGASIRVMQNLSGAHIDVPQQCEEGTNYRKVKMTGKQFQLDYCTFSSPPPLAHGSVMAGCLAHCRALRAAPQAYRWSPWSGGC